ncbi:MULTISPECIES: type II toxin-antitoxin system HicA family toxin [Pseudidiomarina]|uniref:HicA-like toxin of HicAB toxin-antitoxin system n=2 Tax=Pseudidiomarina TaxID=2800384 RepID=A0A368UY05_9GAMM|nr:MULTISPECIES: type II toxin-antitoxin system HicA family toxin [Pseudidiomarina]PWW14239.1 HicA-like toxin of HicAB toxin-antitoxin system [Pseudidiomarina maritima]RBP92053.1 HicA-like toxin of HicAB toxin-antitoxin system [Pseudidiomarina tainanensis]RCW33817.1 HicA-like toxin of HicAB toxin-antitoxin system [Pseudidiomarina tainanensis]
MSGNLLKETLSLFESGKALRCKEVIAALETLGFEVRDGKRGGHKVYVHDGLNDFHSSAFNCDHGKNPQIKPAYIKKIVKVLKQYEQELLELLGEK